MAGGSAGEILKRAAPEAGGGGGSGEGGVWPANSCRINWLTKSDESSPQLGQTNFTGWFNISGVASNAYFAPQEHCSFMMGYGLGFNNTTPGSAASENVS